MGISRQLESISRGFEIVASFPEFRHLPVIIGESDPDGCAACAGEKYPQNAYRNSLLYPSYTAVILKNTLRLAGRHKVNILGMVTWAFEFEGMPYFSEHRALATNGIAKPVLNAFRMFGLMGGERLRATSSAALPLDDMLQAGVRQAPDVDVLATRNGREISVLVWNYHDIDAPAPDTPVRLAIHGIPTEARRLLLLHYRLDDGHSNAFAAWKRMGSPQSPTPEQYVGLEAAGRLELLESPRWLSPQDGALELRFTLPRHALALLQLRW